MSNIKTLITEKGKTTLIYTGIPVICVAFAIVHASRLDLFNMLLYELLIIFGYYAAANDYKTKTISNKLILAMLAAWAVVMLPKVIIDTQAAVNMLINSALGFAIGGGLFLLVYAISRKGLGAGDVKFVAVSGLYLGLWGILPAMLYGSILAGIVSVVLLIMKKISRRDGIPLAPFLFAGILITLFFR